MQTITADFPEEVFVRGAKRVDSGTDDDLRIAMKDNDTSRQVPWSWVIVQPTVLRTSLAYSKVSLNIYFLNQYAFVLDLHCPLGSFPQSYPLHDPHDYQLLHLYNYQEEDFTNLNLSQQN